MTDGSKVVAGVSEGTILAGKYRVERVLGAGGMGVVVAARHIELDEKVAIKFLLGHMLADANSVARFQREAKAAVRIKNEHVVRVFDVGRLEDGAPYMVMEYLEGSDLADWLTKYGALPVAQAVDFVMQACVAVADAHALGIIHRDLKPANLYCVRRTDGQLAIKVLDFGISKLMQPPGAGMSFTQTSAMMGSPLYMSPEQFRSTKNVDARTDIWALGAILFELMTAQPPFNAATVPELAIKIATEPPISATALRRDVAPALAAVIAKCLERDPERRHRDVAELAVALAPFATPGGRALVERIVGIVGKRDTGTEQWIPSESGGANSPPSRAPADRAPSHATGKTGTAPALHWTSTDTPRRSKLPVALGVLAALCVVVAGSIVWLRMRSAPPEIAAPASAEVPSAAPAPVTAVAPLVTAPAAPLVTATPYPSATAPDVTLSPQVKASAAPAVATSPPARGNRDRVKRPAPVVAAGKHGATGPSPAAEPAPLAAPATRNNCDPPFFFDAQGNRVFKQECL